MEGEEKEDKRSAERIISDWTGDRVEVLARNVQTLKTKSNGGKLQGPWCHA